MRTWKLMPRSPQLFWSHVDKSAGPEGCWPWTASIDRHGYGRSSGQAAHRRAFVMANGSIPDGMTIDHMCFTRACQNPRHLRVMTAAENSRNRRDRQHVSAEFCHAGHRFDEANTYNPPGTTTRQCRACGVVRTRRYQLRHGLRGRTTA